MDRISADCVVIAKASSLLKLGLMAAVFVPALVPAAAAKFVLAVSPVSPAVRPKLLARLWADLARSVTPKLN